MYTKAFLSLVSIAAVACAQSVVQGPAPSEVLLSTVQSAVLPVIPTETPFEGVETLEGAIIQKGPLTPNVTGQLGDAVVQQNTAGATFNATLPNVNFNPNTGSTITGSLSATVPENGTGVLITVSFSGFPPVAEYGPFGYHIHGLPVPADGNCTLTLAHLDPTNRGEYYPCDPTQPQTCQAGDLAGKHGNITATTFTASYLDLYLSTDPSSPYYFGDKSIVVHTANTTRITCANFVSSASSTPSNTTSSPSATSSRPVVYTGAANSVALSAGLVGGALFAMFSLL